MNESTYVVVAPLTRLSLQLDYLVDDFPAHVTVLPPFAFAGEERALRDLVGATARSASTFAVVASGSAMFGPKADIPVTLVKSEPFSPLHNSLVQALIPHGWVPVDAAYSGTGYRPHITRISDDVLLPTTVCELAMVRIRARTATVIDLIGIDRAQ